MAKSKGAELAKKFLSISGKVNKDITNYGSTLSSSIFSNIDEYIDTGSYSLNRLITGDIYKGFPRGRVTALAGEAGVGKSFISGMAIKNAQKMGYTVVYYDSENAVDNDFMARIGVDTDSLLYFPMDVIEDFRNHAINTCKQFLDENPEEKIMIVLDSLGNLSCAKEKRDVEQGKDNSDMGQRSKAGASMIKELSHFCGKYRVPFIFTNHTYKDVASAPNPMYAKDIMKGGRGPMYMASAVVMIRKTEEKDETTKKKTGSVLRLFSEKNRLCKDKQDAQMYLSFKSGPNRYFGLIDDAVEAGILERVNSKNYILKDTGEKVKLEKLFNDTVFTKERLDILNEYCCKKYMYATLLDVEDGSDEISTDLGEGSE